MDLLYSSGKLQQHVNMPRSDGQEISVQKIKECSSNETRRELLRRSNIFLAAVLKTVNFFETFLEREFKECTPSATTSSCGFHGVEVTGPTPLKSTRPTISLRCEAVQSVFSLGWYCLICKLLMQTQ